MDVDTKTMDFSAFGSPVAIHHVVGGAESEGPNLGLRITRSVVRTRLFQEVSTRYTQMERP